jgi:hypothetical protein
VDILITLVNKTSSCRECHHPCSDHVRLEDGTLSCSKIALDQYNNPVWVCLCNDLPPHDNLEYLEWLNEKVNKKNS